MGSGSGSLPTPLIQVTQRVVNTLGAGANIRDRKIGALCLISVKVATQQTFSILMPIIKGPPGGPGCHYKDPNAIVKGIRAVVFLFSVDLQYLSCARRGQRDNRDRLHWPWALPSGNLEVLVPKFFLRIITTPIAFELDCAGAAGGRLITCNAAEY